MFSVNLLEPLNNPSPRPSSIAPNSLMPLSGCRHAYRRTLNKQQIFVTIVPRTQLSASKFNLCEMCHVRCKCSAKSRTPVNDPSPRPSAATPSSPISLPVDQCTVRIGQRRRPTSCKLCANIFLVQHNQTCQCDRNSHIMDHCCYP